jgi:hypothetical protein
VRLRQRSRVLQQQSFSSPPIAALLAAAAGLAVSAFAAYRAWLHWQLVFPFGVHGFCGQAAVPHCQWCALAMLGVLLAGMGFASAIRSGTSASTAAFAP